MARSYKKTIVLGLDYSEFQGGITACNNEMKKLDAEFALMQSQMENTSSSTDKLNAQEEYLTQKMHLQAQKVEEAKKKYNALMDAHADTAKIDKADKALLKERTELQKLQNQYDDTKLAQSNFKENATALLATVVTISGAFLQCAKDTAEFADQIMTTSAQSSISTDRLQEWAYASELVDVSVDTMTSSIQKMEKNMANAAKGTGTANDAFKKLGVSVTDSSGNMKDAETIFMQTIDALGKVTNETEQDQLAMDIFGKSASQLTGIIDAGSEGMKTYGDEAERLGRVMSEDDLKAAGEFDDQMQKLDSAVKSLEHSLGSKVIPVLTGFIELISNIPTPVLTTLAIMITVITTLVLLAKTINSVFEAGSAISKVFKNVGNTFDSTYVKILMMVVALTALAAIIAVILGKTNDIKQAGAAIGNIAGNGSYNSATGHNAKGTQKWRGGPTWVGENGPEIVDVPYGAKIYNTDESRQITGGNTYNISMNCDLSRMKSVSDVVEAVEGLGASAQCGGY